MQKTVKEHPCPKIPSTRSSHTTHTITTHTMSADPPGPTQAMTGEVTSTAPVVPGMQPSSLNNKGTIAASASHESVSFLLNRDLIYTDTVTISPDMLPGTVCFIKEICPTNCHAYVRHVSKMFMFWTGGEIIKIRWAATALNGGKIHLAQLPPTYTKEQIRNLDLATLSAYPFIDLDPKDTNPKMFKTVDTRNVQFHRIEEDEEKRTWEDRAGYIVVYIVASLIESLNASGQVQLVIETAGDYEFRTPARISEGPTPGPSNHPLGPSAIDIFHQTGCDDNAGNTAAFGLQVWPVSKTALYSGYTCANGVGGEPWTFMSTSSISAACLQLRTNIEAGMGSFSTSGLCKIGHRIEGDVTIIWSEPTATTLLPVVSKPHNIVMVNEVKIQMPGGDKTKQLAHRIRWRAASLEYVLDDGAGLINWFGDDAVVRYSLLNPTLGSLEDADIDGAPQQLVNPIAGESIVTFCNFVTGTINLQTALMADTLGAINTRATESYLYHLRSEDQEGPLMAMRLHPSGMFTTYGQNTTSVVVKKGTKVWLEFIRRLPMSSPLPAINTGPKSIVKFRTKRMLDNRKMLASLRGEED